MNELNNKQKVIFAVEAILFLGARLLLYLSIFSSNILAAALIMNGIYYAILMITEAKESRAVAVITFAVGFTETVIAVILLA